MNRKISTILAALWFILWGLLSISNFQFQYSPMIMGALAIGAGIFLLFERPSA